MTPRQFIAKCLRRGVLPLLTARRRLPFQLWSYKHFEDPDPELLHLAKMIPRRGVAIDAGANVGIWALALASHCDKVYAFEINPASSQPLKDCGHPNVEIINVGLSNRTGEATLYTPVKDDGMVLNGWASLEPGNCEDARRHRETRVVLKPLDSFVISECSFLKIDVEGHEAEVLEGARETLLRTRPVILIEIRQKNAERVATLLELLGYQRESLLTLAGVAGSADNALYIPRDVRPAGGKQLSPLAIP